MSDQDLLSALNDSIERLREGQSVEDCVHRHPEHAAELRPMLEAGLLARHAGVSSAEVRAAQDRVRFHVQRRLRRPQQGGALRRLVAGIALIMALAGSGVGLAAESSLPDEPLYGVKRFTEDLRLRLLNDADLRATFAQRRIDEVRALTNGGREAVVGFRGTVEAIDDPAWRISGIVVQRVDETAITPRLQVGDPVDVRARTTTARTVIAQSIARIGDVPIITPIQTPTPTVIISPTVTPTLTPTPPPSVTPTLTQTATLTSTPTPTLARTPTRMPPPPAPTQPPAPPRNANDNDNSDNDDDDDDDDDD